MKLLQYLTIGLLAGWIFGRLSRGRGFGLIGNVVIGGIGSLIGGFLCGFFGWPVDNPLIAVVAAVIGAGALFFVLSFLKPRRTPKKPEDS